MSNIYPDLERGKSAAVTGRTHIPTQIFKLSNDLSTEKQQIQEMLKQLSPFNTNKKKEEIIAMLEKWFPRVTSFEFKVNSIKNSIDEMDREKSGLSEKLHESTRKQRKLKGQLADLEDDYNRLMQFIQQIPQNIIDETAEKIRAERLQKQNDRDI